MLDLPVAMSDNIPLNWKEYLRVLRKARTPTIDDFKKTAGITLLGVVIIGLIGFIIYTLMSLV